MVMSTVSRSINSRSIISLFGDPEVCSRGYGLFCASRELVARSFIQKLFTGLVLVCATDLRSANALVRALAASMVLMATLAARAADGKAALPPAREYPLIVINGKSYSNATVRAMNPAEGTVSFQAGGANIFLDDLPEPARSHFYNATNANAFLRNRMAASAAKISAAVDRARAERIAFVRTQKPLRVINGRLYDFSLPLMEMRRGINTDLLVDRYARYVLLGTVFQVANDGLLIKQYYTDDIVFLKNYPREDVVLDDSRVHTIALVADRYQYTTVLGATRTTVLYDWGRVYDPDTDNFPVKVWVSPGFETNLDISEADKEGARKVKPTIVLDLKP